MKKSLIPILFLLALLGGGCSHSNRTVVILSTNDMHAKIERMPLLATAIKECRDTAEVILVDAGDRWTGNAYVDLVEGHRPIYELMNELEYDFAIYGNHEFDCGQAELAVSDRQSNFEFICANLHSDTTSFPQVAPYKIVERAGHKIAFVGAVSNYSNSHPSGKDESFVGLRFSDPQAEAAKYSYLREENDALIFVTHMGYERDKEFALSLHSKGYDQVIGAHSHDVIDEEVNGVLITQTGKHLVRVGATVLTFDKAGKLQSLDYRNIPLDNYSPDAKVEQMVADYKNSPELNSSIGEVAESFNHTALKNLFAQVVKKSVGADIGLYHAGGVRLDKVEKGGVSQAVIFNLEPFGSTVATVHLTTKELKNIIMLKYNDTENVDEAKYLDLTATEPYTIVTDKSGNAVDVLFPTLKAGRKYTVATGDYIYKSYKGVANSTGKFTDILITSLLSDYIKANSPVMPKSESLQSIK